MFEKLKKIEFPILIIFINIILLFFLPSSILYNNQFISGDSSIYHIAAKEMLNGKILYKDIFDHKGPFIFFIYILTTLFKNPQIMFFLIDLILYNIIFILNYKTLKLNNNLTISFFIITLEFLILFNSFNTLSPETFMLLTISYLNYWILSKQYLNPTKTQLIICGIFTGLIFWIKFTLGVYIAIIYFYFIYTHIKNKTFNYKYILIPLIGFLIPTIIVFVYFIYNNSLYYLFYNYFLLNSKYKNSNIIKYSSTMIVLLLTIISLLILSLKNKKIKNLIILISYGLLFIFTFILTKNDFIYYYIPFISILSIVQININKFKKIIFSGEVLLLIFVLIFLSSRFNSLIIKESNLYINKEINTVAIIGSSNPEILTNIENINYKYFFTPNLTYEQYPEMWNTIYNDIKNKNLKYIVFETYDNHIIFTNIFEKSEKTNEKIIEITELVKENYELSDEHIQNNKNYKIYKLK